VSEAAVERLALPEAIAGPGVIAIARRRPAEELDRVARSLLECGIEALEITLDGDDALASIERLVATFAGQGLVVGAGTVLDVSSARAAANVGAGFIVSPHHDPELVSWAVVHGVAVLPGAMTPGEVLAAWRGGATAVKVFPASTVGPGFVRELRGPLREIPLVPTGGLSADTAADFIEAGAVAVGLGGWLIGDGEPDGLRARARAAVAAVERARNRAPS
jgi:2-dehydro-3-deoxyphosphogluconate aldolase/(4S)-4-hydroxy-2-oxoglutarate aldolase